MNTIKKTLYTFFALLFIWWIGPMIAFRSYMPLTHLWLQWTLTLALFAYMLYQYRQPLYQRIQDFDYKNITLTTSHLWRAAITGSCAVVVMGFAWHAGYKSNQKTMLAFHALVQTQNKNLNAHSNLWLTTLNMQRARYNLLTHSSAMDYRWIGLSQTAQLAKKVRQQYAQALTKDFIPYIKSISEQSLKGANKNHPLALYNALKVNLMASESTHLNAEFISHWYSQKLKALFTHQSAYQSALMTHLHYSLQHQLFHWPENKNLIKQKRATIAQLMLSRVSFLVFQSNTQQHFIPVLKDTTATHDFQYHDLRISSLYMSSNFKEIYGEELSNTAVQNAHGDWVTGKINVGTINAKTKKKLITDLRADYLDAYRAAWTRLLNHFTITPQTSLTQLQQQIQTLQNPKSTVWHVLHLLESNSTLNSNNQTSVGLFLNHDQGYDGFQAALYTLKNSINSLLTSPDSTQASYVLAANRAQTNNHNDTINLSVAVAKKLPTPISGWLTEMAQNYWQLVLAQSRQYINHLWKNNVLTQYKTSIDHRYPIFAQSKQDINPIQFTQFFGPGGTLDTFFSYYLQPFVDTQQHYWTWKTINGSTLGIPQHTLDMLIRASLIQKMFFTDSTTGPLMRFSLLPKAFSKNTQSLTLNIGGQMISVTPKSDTATAAQWPGNQGDFVTLRFVDINGSKPTVTYTGPWAWLRLIDANKLTGTDNPQMYALHLKLGNDRARLALSADNLVNPYLPNILSRFRCPTHL